MSLKGIFNYFLKNDSTIRQLKRKINELEKRLESQKAVQTCSEKAVQKVVQTGSEKAIQTGSDSNTESNKTADDRILPPIVIEKLNVERLVVDKVELNNNFGQLGIKELKGRLNIGATYGEGGILDYIKKEGEQINRNNDTSTSRTKTEKKTVEPKVNMKSR
jgi:hypothetical protein